MKSWISLVLIGLLLASCAPTNQVYGLGIDVIQADDSYTTLLVIDGSSLDSQSKNVADCVRVVEPITVSDQGEAIAFRLCGLTRGSKMGAIIVTSTDSGTDVMLLALYDTGHPWPEATVSIRGGESLWTVPMSLEKVEVIHIPLTIEALNIAPPDGCKIQNPGNEVLFFTCSTAPLAPYNL